MLGYSGRFRHFRLLKAITYVTQCSSSPRSVSPLVGGSLSIFSKSTPLSTICKTSNVRDDDRSRCRKLGGEPVQPPSGKSLLQCQWDNRLGARREMSSSIPDAWRKLSKQLIDTKLEEDGIKKCYINKDPGYGEFNKFGKINPWCLLDYFEASVNLFDLSKMTKGLEHISVFARNIEMNLKPGTEASMRFDRPLKFAACMSYLGRSSVCWDTQCLDCDTGEELANFAIQMVTVDLKVRKQVPVAHDIGKPFCPENIRTTPPQGFDLEFKPENAFAQKFTVNWSDTDFNSHLNQADMLRMCVDSGSFAAMQKKLSAFSKELVAYDLKRCSIMFMREARPGEEVLVECWEGEENPLILNFVFSKKGDLITALQLEYHAGDAELWKRNALKL